MANKRVFITGTERDGSIVTFAVDAITAYKEGKVSWHPDNGSEGGKPTLTVHLQSTIYFQFKCDEATRVLGEIKGAI